MTSVADRLANKTKARPARKQVRLRLVHIDFWSLVKLAFLWSLVLAVIGIIVSFLLWMVLEQTGVLDSINKMLNDVAGSKSSVQLSSLINLGQVMLFSVIVGILNCIAFPALMAVWAFIYNLSVRVTGGLVFGFTNN